MCTRTEQMKRSLIRNQIVYSMMEELFHIFVKKPNKQKNVLGKVFTKYHELGYRSGYNDSLRTGGSGIESRWRQGFPHFLYRPWGQSGLLYNGYRIITGVRRPGRDVDHLPPSSAEVKERLKLVF
jgi:hypothetical protein